MRRVLYRRVIVTGIGRKTYSITAVEGAGKRTDFSCGQQSKWKNSVLVRSSNHQKRAEKGGTYRLTSENKKTSLIRNTSLEMEVLNKNRQCSFSGPPVGTSKSSHHNWGERTGVDWNYCKRIILVIGVRTKAALCVESHVMGKGASASATSTLQNPGGK